MKPALFYLLQVVACSGILYGYYHFLLRNKKFHQYNRYFLLLTVVISIVIPFLHIPVYFEPEESKPLLVQTISVFSSEGSGESFAAGEPVSSSSWFTWQNILSIIYVVAGLILFTRFWLSLMRVIRMMRIYPGEKVDNIRFIQTDEPSTPFSFFRWLFWNSQIQLNTDFGQQILRHELFHIRQKHSRDVIFLELVSIILWLNPFFHLIRKEIQAIHEFLADKHAVHENDEWDYAELLLMQALGTSNTRLINPFFHNQIKRRIAMLTTSNKPGYQYLRKIMVLPLAAILIGLFAFNYKNKHKNAAAWQGEPFTIVVDAGHGGDDPGATSADGKVSEATLALQLSKKIQALAKEYNVNVVMTRNSAAFPGNAADKNAALRKRIEISNESDPVAFISVHVNTTGKATQDIRSGFEVYIADNGGDASSRLASVVLQNLSSLYKTRGDVVIRKSQGVYVLDKNTKPAILLHCGYINNAADLAFITDRSNQEKIARNILEAIVRYRTKAGDLSASPADTTPSVISDRIVSDQKITMKADTFILKSNNNNKDAGSQPPLIVLNDVKMQPGILNDRAIIADQVEVYPKADAEAIRLYGQAAANGLIIFKNAVVSETKVVSTLAKVEDNDTVPGNKIFYKVEIEPAFPGGAMAWKKFLERNMNENIASENGAPPGHYTVMVQFIVDENGSVSDVTPLTNHGYGMEKEATRLIQKGPKWMPGIQNGKKVKSYKKQPFNFITGTNDQSTKADATNNLKEVVVEGYPTKKANRSEKEIGVEGKPTIKEVPIEKKADLEERVVIGKPLKKIVFEQTEFEPSFPGGNDAWLKYLQVNVKPGIPADNGAPAGVYNVGLMFIVNTDGTISEIHPVTDFGYGMEEEALRLIKISPRWIPAKQNGKNVNAYKKQYITFRVPVALMKE